MSGMIQPVCSNRPRPAVQANGKHGNQWWGRDVYHAAKSGMATYCGRDASDWIRMDQMSKDAALVDHNFCARCAARLTRSVITT